MNKYKIYPYFKWHYFHSWQKDSPNIAKFKVIDVLPSKAVYAIIVNVKFYNKGMWFKMTLPLWNYKSNNRQLLDEWEKNLSDGKIKKGKTFILNTWKEYSKTGNTIRRFVLEF